MEVVVRCKQKFKQAARSGTAFTKTLKAQMDFVSSGELSIHYFIVAHGMDAGVHTELDIPPLPSDRRLADNGGCFCLQLWNINIIKWPGLDRIPPAAIKLHTGLLRWGDL